jgi:hypothetical protein
MIVCRPSEVEGSGLDLFVPAVLLERRKKTLIFNLYSSV